MDNGVISGLHTWLAVSLISSQYYGDITLLPPAHLLDLARGPGGDQDHINN